MPDEMNWIGKRMFAMSRDPMGPDHIMARIA